MSNKQTEFNILGCTIRVKSDEDNSKAMQAIELLTEEISKIKSMNSSLKDQDVAVLSALNLASRSIDTEGEYKKNIFALRDEVQDALKHINSVSSSAESGSL